MWIVPPDLEDSPEDCAEWFVQRVTVALCEAEERGLIRLRSGDLDLLEISADNLSKATHRKVASLIARTSNAVRVALDLDILAAQSAGLVSRDTGLPLSWIVNYERGLDAKSYPVAAQLAAVVANFAPVD